MTKIVKQIVRGMISKPVISGNGVVVKKENKETKTADKSEQK